MDINGDGRLSKDEIQKGFAQYFGRSLNDKEVDDMFEKVDADGSGEIDYSEFVVATMNEKNLLSNNKLQTAFKMFDKDGGGSISTDEIKQVLSFGQNLDEKVIADVIKQVDANGDGEISFEEFAEMMKSVQWGAMSIVIVWNRDKPPIKNNPYLSYIKEFASQLTIYFSNGKKVLIITISFKNFMIFIKWHYFNVSAQ